MTMSTPSISIPLASESEQMRPLTLATLNLSRTDFLTFGGSPDDSSSIFISLPNNSCKKKDSL